LTASHVGELIQLDFPSIPEQPAEPPAGLIEALGVRPLYVGRGRFDYLVEVADERVLRGMTPDFGGCGSLRRGGDRHLPQRVARLRLSLALLRAASRHRRRPVTGSAHCCLAPFWGHRFGRDAMVGNQASRRGGVVHVQLAGDRVILAATP